MDLLDKQHLIASRGDQLQAAHTPASQGKQSQMSVDVALEANAQLAKSSQPGMGALDHPTMAAQPVIAFNPPTGDAVLDAMTPQMRPTSRMVVALVGVQFCRPALRSTSTAPDAWLRVNQLLEDNRIVTIGSRDAEHQRDAPAVRDQMAFAAELASVRGIRPGVRAPGGWARWPRQHWRG